MKYAVIPGVAAKTQMSSSLSLPCDKQEASATKQ